jgi:hypothetical protein
MRRGRSVTRWRYDFAPDGAATATKLGQVDEHDD